MFCQMERGGWSHHSLFAPRGRAPPMLKPCPSSVQIEMLTTGGRKSVVTEEAVPGGGQRGNHGQHGLDRQAWGKRRRPAVTRCLRLARGRIARRTNSRVCWDVGPWFGEEERRRLTKNKSRLLDGKGKERRRVTRREEDERRDFSRRGATDVLNKL